MISRINSKIVNQILTPNERNKNSLIESLKRSQGNFKKSNELKKYGGLDFNFKEQNHSNSSSVSEVLTSNSVMPVVEKKVVKSIKSVSQNHTSGRVEKTILNGNRAKFNNDKVEKEKRVEQYFKGKDVEEKPDKMKTFLISKKPEIVEITKEEEPDVNETEKIEINLSNEEFIEVQPAEFVREEIQKNDENEGKENKIEEKNEIEIVEKKVEFNEPKKETNFIEEEFPKKTPSKPKRYKSMLVKNTEKIQNFEEQQEDEELRSSMKMQEIREMRIKNSHKMKEKLKISEKEISKPNTKRSDRSNKTSEVKSPKFSKKHSAASILINQENEKPQVNKTGKKISLIQIEDVKTLKKTFTSEKITSIETTKGRDFDLASNLSTREGMKRKNIMKMASLKSNSNLKKYSSQTSTKLNNKAQQYDEKKFMKYDAQNLAYQTVKGLNCEINSDLNQDFVERMKKDVERRQEKEEKLKRIMSEKEVKLAEEQRLKTFNRLIHDANRRIESREKILDIKEKEEKTKNTQTKPSKKYEDKDWEEIYEERFGKFQDEKNRKIKEKRIEKRSKEKEVEQLIVNRINSVKKSPEKEIEKSSKRLCDDEMIKRKNNIISLNKKFTKEEEEKMKKTVFVSNKSILEKIYNSDSERLSNYYSGKESIKSPRHSISKKEQTILTSSNPKVLINSPSSSLKRSLNYEDLVGLDQKGKQIKKMRSVQNKAVKTIKARHENKLKNSIDVDKFKRFCSLNENEMSVSDSSSVFTSDIKSLKGSINRQNNKKKNFIPDSKAAQLWKKLLKRRSFQDNFF